MLGPYLPARCLQPHTLPAAGRTVALTIRGFAHTALSPKRDTQASLSWEHELSSPFRPGRASSELTARGQGEAPPSQWGLGNWERGELPPSSGLFLPYLVLIERLKEISPGCSLEGLMLKLKLQYFGHLMRRADSFEKTLMERLRAGREGDDRG